MSELCFIPKGTLLYRCSTNVHSYETRLCNDTGKIGLYFGYPAIISLAMCVEHDKLLEFGIFRTKKDMYIHPGKYSFRNILPHKYWTSEGKFIPNVFPEPIENIDHLDCIYPLNSDQQPLLPEHIEAKVRPIEIFLTDPINCVELIESYKFSDKVANASELLKYMQENDFPFDEKKYIDDQILVELI